MKCRVTTSRLPYYPEFDEEYPDLRAIPSNADFVQYDYDLRSLAEYIGRPRFTDITGAFVVIGDGDYDRIFVTWERRPYELDCEYYEVKIHLH